MQSEDDGKWLIKEQTFQLSENDWISVKDRLPESTDLIYVRIQKTTIGRYDSSFSVAKWQKPKDAPQEIDEEITHWMPINE